MGIRVMLGAWIAAMACAATPCRAQVIDIDPVGEDGRLYAGWFVTTPGFEATAQSEGGLDGEACARLTGAAEDESSFGNFMSSLDARPYRGKLLRLRAALRFEGDPPNGAQMWVRVDRETTTGFFENMGDGPVRDDAWGHYEIVGPVAEDARRISFGVMLVSAGDVWIDDVSLEMLETPPPEAARPLQGRGLDNLLALAELLTLVRHFHPSDEAATADWDAVAVAGVRMVESAEDAPALAEALTELMAPLAPSAVIRASGPMEPGPSDADVSELDVLAWSHFGFGQDDPPPGLYERERQRAAADAGVLSRLLGGVTIDMLPDPREPLRVELPGGVTAWVPLAVHADESRSLPRATATPTHLPAPLAYSGDDRATRLAGVILAWGVFEHFYPYFDVVDVDWPGELRRALSGAAEAEDAEAQMWVLRRMVGSLDDGHGYVGHAADSRTAGLPMTLAWAGDELVVSHVRDGVDDVERGDVVVSRDGRPLSEWIAEARQAVSAATDQYARSMLSGRFRLGPAAESLELGVRGADGGVRTIQLSFDASPWSAVEPRPEPLAELAPGVVYVDIERLDDAEFEAGVPAMAAAQRIVFDFRGYPGRLSPQTIFGHLIDEHATSAEWLVPRVRRPDEAPEFESLSRWSLIPQEPYFEADRVFLIDGRAISYAESCMGIVEHYGLGAIVGEATAGTNGNINPFVLPGDYRVSWTGMKVLKHDGSQHHGVGILPTHPVERTVEGIREGRDELLEAAVALP
jgi:hypothetical protein